MSDHLPAAPDPKRLAHVCDQLVAVLTGGGGLSLADDYDWLFASGYRRPKTETHQRTRREVAGVSGTLADGYDELDRVRHHLRTAAASLQRALDEVRGARAALRRAQETVEGQSRHLVDAVAEDPLPRSAPDRRELARLSAAQQRRRTRGTAPWSASEESFG